MFKVTQAREIVVKTLDEPGHLAEVVKAVAERGVSLLALSIRTDGPWQTIWMVTDDNLRAAIALRQRGFSPREARALAVELENRPGLLRHLTDRLASAGIDMRRLYASALPESGRCLAIFSCSDNDRAMVLLNTGPWAELALTGGGRGA